MTSEDIVAAFTTLLVVVDPPGLAPIFVALTDGMTNAQKREVAVRAALIAAAVLVGFALVGDRLLGALGITLPAFRIAGGLLLFWIAFEMVFGRREPRKSSTAQAAIDLDHIRNVAAFPLAVPLIAGPGAITATILLAERAGGRLADLVVVLAAALTAVAATFLVFVAARPIDRLLGVTGRVVLSRLLGVLLSALAIQFVADGVGQLVR